MLRQPATGNRQQEIDYRPPVYVRGQPFLLPVGLLALALGFLIPACVWEIRPPYGHVYYTDEGHRRPVHDYYYYPDAEVYYDPIAIDWFWFDRGIWHNGRHLPSRYHVSEHDRYSFRSDARRPYEVHERIRQNVHERRNVRERGRGEGGRRDHGR